MNINLYYGSMMYVFPQVNILYLNPDNTLTDFKDINDERTKEEEIVKDYKCKKRQVIKYNQSEFVIVA